MSDIKDLTAIIEEFCQERDWDQFHGPKDLAIGVTTEGAELLDLFRFKSDAEALAKLQEPAFREKVSDELADVFFFVLRFAQMNQIELAEALKQKLVKNAVKYPVSSAKGSNKKYNE
jgi:NTP pyrophosphatase (non-canonical NTP hydrolase)